LAKPQRVHFFIPLWKHQFNSGNGKRLALTVRIGSNIPMSIVLTDAIQVAPVTGLCQIPSHRSSTSILERSFMLSRNQIFGLLSLMAASAPYALFLLTLLKLTTASTLGFTLIVSPMAAIAFGILGRKEIMAKLAFVLTGLNVILIAASLSMFHFNTSELQQKNTDVSGNYIRMQEQLNQIQSHELGIAPQPEITNKN
jgi:hypothetical protein